MIGHHLKKSNWVTQYEIYQDHDFIGGCFFDSGNGIFSAFLDANQRAFCQASLSST
jgi:hypothetical protein